jgi:uncharacterized membrane protein YfcA
LGNNRSTAASISTPTHVVPLGIIGGLLDAIGGGGWGAMVTSTLIGWGMMPRLAIGSTNLAEFFVTIVITATFVATIGLELWPIIAGLVAGGVLAAPFAAFMTRRLPKRSIDASRRGRDCVSEPPWFAPKLALSARCDRRG